MPLGVVSLIYEVFFTAWLIILIIGLTTTWVPSCYHKAEADTLQPREIRSGRDG